MLARCDDLQDKNYGGRGIIVCEAWQTFEGFLYDMGERPVGLTLDRKNNDGPYVKWNCRWATMKEQTHNRRGTKLTENVVAEIRTCLAVGERGVVLAAKFGVSRSTVSMVKHSLRW
jgi:hypothetical protein